MRIEIHSLNPTALLTKIKKDINDGNNKTWSIVKLSNGEFFTHTPDQWLGKALLESITETDPNRLILRIRWYANVIPNQYTKGLYIGRFTEQLLEHYGDDFSKLETFAK
jgi:hypothetical protein